MGADVNPHQTEHLRGASSFGWANSGNGLLRAGSRRWFLQAGAAGLAGLSALPGFGSNAPPPSDKRAVILFWLSGGPSHIDMWDPKPDAPSEIRGPFSTIATKLPGVRFCEHLP